MSLHKEIEFESDICVHLAAHGWLYAENDYSRYDRARALFPADVVAWVQATQPQAWETLVKNHGAARCAGGLSGRGAAEPEKVRSGLKDILLGPAQLYEALRGKGRPDVTA